MLNIELLYNSILSQDNGIANDIMIRLDYD